MALLTTLTPANSQPLPHIHAPEYARHPACQHRCIPFHAAMATTGQCQTRAVGRVAAPRRRGHCPPPHSPTHRGGGGGVCVCERVPSGCGSPHHTHSRQLPTTPSHSRARIRTPPACQHRCIPFHSAMATTGQCQTRAVGRVAAPNRRGHCPPPHSPTHRVVVVVCVCVNECRVAVALLTTLSPFQRPTTSSHSRARIRTPPACQHRCIPFHAAISTIEQCQTRPVGSEAARTLPTTTLTNTQGWWWCVCVCERVPSGCGSPHHTHSRQLPTTSSHSRARIRTPPACQHRCIPFHSAMATTGQCQTRAVGRVAAPRRRGHCPPTHRGGGGVCVCV